ncbi:hypothetical protein P7C71_g545, partial [Lecanoromycetidae sp. Uapishka_2]
MCIGSVTVSGFGAASQATSTVSNTGLTRSGLSTSFVPSSNRGSSTQSASGATSSDIQLPATITSTLNPTGIAASASASSLQIAIIYASRAIQSYIDNPEDETLQKDAEDEIERAKDLSIEFADELPDPVGGGDCGHGSGFLGFLENVVSCSEDTLDKLGDDIKGGTDDIDDLKNDLSDLGNYIQPLVPNSPPPDPPEEDPNETDSQPSATDQDEEPSQTSQPEPFLNSKVPSPSSVTFLEATGIIAFWGIPAEATDAALAGLTPSEVEEIKQQPGVDDVVPNASLTPDSDPDVPLTTITAATVSLATVTVQPIDTEDIVPPTGVGPPIDTAEPTASGSAAGQKRHQALYDDPMDLELDARTESLERRKSLPHSGPHRGERLAKRMPPPYVAGEQLRAVPPRTDGADVPYELRAVSQPNTNPLPDFSELDYIYRIQGGRDTWGYVIDSGLRASHQEFQTGCTIVPNNQWIILPGATSANDDPNGHGTAVTSKICGANTPEIQRVKPVLGEIMDLGVVIVVSAGNDRLTAGSTIVKAPEVWAAPNFPLIVVSSVDRNFQVSDFSQIGLSDFSVIVTHDAVDYRLYRYRSTFYRHSIASHKRGRHCRGWNDNGKQPDLFDDYATNGKTFVLGGLESSVTATGNALCDYPTLPTVTVRPTQVTPSSTTSPSPGTTTAPPPPPPPPPTPNLAIIIYREDDCDDTGCDSAGYVYDITPGEPVNVCDNPPAADTFEYTEDVQNDNSNYPIASDKFTSHGTWKNCQYVGHNNVVGLFTCDGLAPVQCIVPTAQAQSCTSSHDIDEDNFTPIVYCAWVS